MRGGGRVAQPCEKKIIKELNVNYRVTCMPSFSTKAPSRPVLPPPPIAMRCHSCPFPLSTERGRRYRRSRSEDVTTLTEDRAMAAPATQGGSWVW